MTLQVRTEFRGTLAPRYKVVIFHIVYKGPDEGIVNTGLTNILYVSAINMRTGKPIRVGWEKGGSCVLIGPIKEGKEGIIKVKVEGW